MTSQGPSGLNDPLLSNKEITSSHIYKVRPEDLE